MPIGIDMDLYGIFIRIHPTSPTRIPGYSLMQKSKQLFPPPTGKQGLIGGNSCFETDNQIEAVAFRNGLTEMVQTDFNRSLIHWLKDKRVERVGSTVGSETKR